MNTTLERVEAIIDTSGATARIEALLPVGVKPRQLQARTLLIGMTLAMLDGRDALLTAVHRTLTALPEPDQRRLGVIARWNTGPHTLTYRQTEYTSRLIADKLSKDQPDGRPSQTLSEMLDALLEASVQVLGEPDSTSYAVDWTAQETWSRPPPRSSAKDQPAAPENATATTTDAQPAVVSGTEAPAERKRRSDAEASWGHRNTNHPSKTDMFYGYYLQAVTAVNDEGGPPVPELVRRIQLASCDHDPPAQIVPVIKRMAAGGVPISDLLADSGYAYRVAQTWALPLRTLDIGLVMDLHPNDRGPTGTHQGAIVSNGNLYCPATPKPLLKLGPLARNATAEQTQTHDRQCAELARYKLSPITGHDHDGYHRVTCPAAQGKIRCPHRPASMSLAHTHPTVTDPPAQPPVCCAQKTITVPPSVCAKTTQKHDYPSPQHRCSYQRRTASERTFATTSDRATNDLSRGWCRLFDLTPIALFTATVFIARNIRIHNAFAARQAEDQRRNADGLAPTRRRRRQTTTDLINAAIAPP